MSTLAPIVINNSRPATTLALDSGATAHPVAPNRSMIGASPALASSSQTRSDVDEITAVMALFELDAALGDAVRKRLTGLRSAKPPRLPEPCRATSAPSSDTDTDTQDELLVAALDTIRLIVPRRDAGGAYAAAYGFFRTATLSQYRITINLCALTLTLRALHRGFRLSSAGAIHTLAHRLLTQLRDPILPMTSAAHTADAADAR